MTKYSQHEIEKYLAEYFTTPGHFLEIGAWDGELISQTAWLERERGWQGICIDPFPRNFELRSCRVVSAAVSRDGKAREFIRVYTDKRDGGDVSYFSGFKDTIAVHWPLIRDHCEYTEMIVNTITLEEIYKIYRLPDHIEFLSVDTEGSEFEIFDAMDFDRRSFGLIVFEHNESGRVRDGIGKILGQHGYCLIDALRCDDIYVNVEMLK